MANSRGAEKEKREYVNDENIPGDWFVWVKIMTNCSTAGFSERCNPVNDGYCPPGYSVDSMPFAHMCGIYELAISKDEKRKVATYVGSTCRKPTGDCLARLQEYCNNGSHIRHYIDGALNKGYAIYARVKQSGDMQTSVENARKLSGKDEDTLLERYNYAWNKRKNGEKRTIYPYENTI